MSRLPPSNSLKPPAAHQEPTGQNRRARRTRQRHRAIFTSHNVIRDKEGLNAFGFEVMANRLAKRRKKSEKWAKKYAIAMAKRYRALEAEWHAKMIELFQEHNHGEEPESERTD